MSESAQGTRHVTTVFQETLGRDLLKLIVDELRTQPNHWLRMDQEEQGKALERIKGKVKAAVIDCSAIIMATNFPMVKAELDGITIKDGVKISLTMAAGDPNRHQLYDAKGSQCLLVMGTAEEWLERMDEVKAAADQKDLFDGDYDPKDDQPGYRRDQSATKPAGKTWAEIKAGFEQGLLTQSEAEEQFGGPLPEQDPNPDPLDIKGADMVGQLETGAIEYRSLETDEPDSWGPWTEIPKNQHPAVGDDETMREVLTAIHDPITSEFRWLPPVVAEPPSAEEQAEIDRKAKMLGLQEALTDINMTISLGAVQALSEEQRIHTGDWLIEYVVWASNPKRTKKSMPKRPHFLPLFEPLPPPEAPKDPPASTDE